MTDRQDISLSFVLESAIENVNYGAEYCGTAFSLLFHFLSLSLFCSGPLFCASLSL
jgi:hypothetical protein